jgi:uncharacterized LabA/DUF88 family protein
MNPIRVMVFYDGNYFKQGQLYFRYKENRGWVSLPEFHATLEKYVASKAKSPMEVTKMVGSHYYDGRATTKAIGPDQLEKERDFEMALIAAGVVPHYLAVTEKLKPGGDPADPEYVLAQKGVDVKLALDVLDFAHENRLDVAALVTGDGDFVPLVRKITSLGKQALIVHFDIAPWTDSKGFPHRGVYCSRALIDAASWSLNLNHFVKDPDWKTEVKALFFQPKEKPVK